MPFGLDLKTIIVTILFMMFVLPFVRSKFLSATSKPAQQAQ
jgi:hypothetical protein